MIVERKTALITGAASGIGRATTERFSVDPKYQWIYAIDKDPAIDNLFPKQDYPRVVPRTVDLSGYEVVSAAVNEAFDLSNRLDVVVNAAGVMIEGDPLLVLGKRKRRQYDATQAMSNINLGTVLTVMVKASLLMRECGGGTIINITSAKHFYPDIYHLEYSRDKALLSRVTRGLAKKYLKENNVRLVDVQPGNTKTNIDRGDWISENNKTEIETVSLVNNWWRNKFGNDPKNVADVIYEIAEGRRIGSPVYVGLDTQIGRALYLATYPTIFLRSDMVFFYGSTLFYKALTLGNMVRRRFNRKTAIQS